MKQPLVRYTLRGLAAGALLLAHLSAAAQARREYLLTNDWKFAKGDVPGAARPDFQDSKWQTVSIPHDWAIYGPFSSTNDLQKVKIEQNNEAQATTKAGRTGGLPFIGTGWYRRQLAVPGFGAGQRAMLVFDGAMSDAHVFVNGKEVGRWPYGYNTFHFDITAFLQAKGPNTLAVRLENQPEASRWYPGAGLYRHVHLLVTDDVHIPVWGTYLTTPEISASAAQVKLKTKVEMPAGTAAALRLETEIRDAAGKVVAKASTPLPAGGQEFEQNITVPNPRLWSPETPVLYSASSKLFAGDVLKDEYTTPFGIRSFRFESGKGFSLNGQPRKFRGVCNHHDLGPLGAAVNTAALRRQLTLLKDLGADAIRTTHNMPAPELVQL